MYVYAYMCVGVAGVYIYMCTYIHTQIQKKYNVALACCGGVLPIPPHQRFIPPKDLPSK